MEKRALKVVQRPREPRRSGRAELSNRPLTLALAAATILAALVALLVGSDPVRYPVAARDVAESALRTALERGSRDEEVIESLVDLRRSLGSRPLDSRTRVIYADLLLGLSRQLSDTAAAAAHASRAAKVAPVTVPVILRATMVLVRAGRSDEAVALTREMFSYDTDSAAESLFRIETMLYAREVVEALPEDPDAWLAWARRLRLEDRQDRAYEVVLESHERWPNHLETTRFVAARAVRDKDWTSLSALFPPEQEIPRVPGAAPVLGYRARLKAQNGDLDGARSDIAAALEIEGRSNVVDIVVGEAFEALGEVDEARRHWNRALFEIPTHEVATRRNVLARLARLEERHGRASDALHLWEDLLRIDSGHAEARRRIQALTSFER